MVLLQHGNVPLSTRQASHSRCRSWPVADGIMQLRFLEQRRPAVASQPMGAALQGAEHVDHSGSQGVPTMSRRENNPVGGRALEPTCLHGWHKVDACKGLKFS